MSSLVTGTRGAVTLTLALAMIAAGGLPLEAQNNAITGVLKNSAGEPVVGALVKIKSDSVEPWFPEIGHPGAGTVRHTHSSSGQVYHPRFWRRLREFAFRAG